MKHLIFAFFIFTTSFTFAQNYSESEITSVFGEVLKDAGEYALKEMRPTANIRTSKIIKVKNDTQDNGGDIKARIEVTWVTAFTRRTRTHINDVWLSIRAGEVYFTRYKLYSDDHNIQILNRKDVRMNKLIGSFNDSSDNDDF